MKRFGKTLIIIALPLVASVAFGQAPGKDIAPLRAVDNNPRIDIREFLAVSQRAAEHREKRRISEEEFIRMSAEPGTVILDARSAEAFGRLHVEGAVNLSFPDIATETLDSLFPDKNQRILIYCNNNFFNLQSSSYDMRAMLTKKPGASLNLSTYISLYTYGYHNVYELAPLIDINKTKLKLVSSAKPG